MLHLKYRPSKLSQVIGNAANVKSLSSLLEKGETHFFMLVGEGGTGKTTIARIIGKMLDIEIVEEINAANSNGVEFARDLSSRIHMKSFGKPKLYIIDECQRLTSEAQDILLKDVLEDTPPHAYVVFCTTDPQKIKKTVASRAAVYSLQKPTFQELVDYLSLIAGEEKMTVSRKSLSKIARTSGRVLRDSLIMLHQIRGLTEEEACSIIEGYDSEDEVELIELGRALSKNAEWTVVASILSKMKATPDSAIVFLRAYMSKVLLNSGKKNTAFNLLVAASGYQYGSGMPGLVKVCYEACLRNENRN